MSMTAEIQRKYGDVSGAIAISLVVQTIISLLAACTPVLAPQIAASRGWDPALITFYAPIVSIASLVMAFQVPRLLWRIGGMGLKLTCVAFCVLGLLCLLVPKLAVVMVVPFFIGLSNGATNAAGSQILGQRTTSRTAGLIMSIKQTGVPLGGVLAGILIPFLTSRSNWQQAVLELVAVSTVVAVFLLPTVNWLNGDKGTAPPGKYRPFDPLKRLLAMPGMLPILIAAMVFTGMQLCLRSFLVVYLVNDRGVSLGTAGLVFSITQAAGIIGQVLWATLSDRVWTSHVVMAIVGAMMTVAAALTAMFTTGWPLVALFIIAVLYGGSAAGFVPVVLGEVARRSPPGQAGALTSGASLFLIIGVLLGPLTFGAALSATDYRGAFLTLASCTLAVTVFVAMPRHSVRG
jgi:MFS family permease